MALILITSSPHPLIPSSPHHLIPSSPHPLIPSSPHQTRTNMYIAVDTMAGGEKSERVGNSSQLVIFGSNTVD